MCVQLQNHAEAGTEYPNKANRVGRGSDESGVRKGKTAMKGQSLQNRYLGYLQNLNKEKFRVCIRNDWQKEQSFFFSSYQGENNSHICYLQKKGQEFKDPLSKLIT